MKTTKVLAIRQHVYEGVPRKAGEIYDVTESALKILVAWRKVRPLETRLDRNQYERRDMRAKQ